MWRISFMLILGLLTHYTGAEQEHIVSTSHGKVSGLTRQMGASMVTHFLSVPYAKPPVGKLRFQRPQIPDGWEDVLNCSSYGPICYTPFPEEVHLLGNILSDRTHLITQSEDCLTLNILYPDDFSSRMSSLKAVMVFIHGGGYVMGSANHYNGSVLAMEGDVLYVAINYRLAVLGFASTADGLISGNMGLFDQNAALVWVRDNIEAFGGDPKRVTLFGESAGADAVVNHLISPLSDGLFQRVIIQSAYDYYKPSKENHEEMLKQIAKSNWGCDEESTSDLLECLQGLPAEKLAKINIQDSSFLQFLFQAVIIDGVFLTDNPLQLFKDGKFNIGVEVIIGFNGYDGFILPDFLQKVPDGLFTNGLPDKQGPIDMLKSIWSFIFRDEFSNFPNAEKMLDLLISEYLGPDKCATDRARGFMDLFTDYSFAAKSIAISDAIAKSGGVVHLYELDYHSDKFSFAPFTASVSTEEGTIPKLAYHGEDLFYVFGQAYLLGDQEEKQISQSMMKTWTEFAKTGRAIYLAQDSENVEWIPYFLPEKYYCLIDAPLTRESGAQELPGKFHRRMELWYSTLAGLAEGNRKAHIEL